MRLGIYGGTFNPIHNGHIHILYEFSKRLALDKTLIIPTATPPHKQTVKLASAEDRMKMCGLVAGEISGASAEVSDIEIKRKGKSFTADTLKQLKAICPYAEMFLLMGEDMLLSFGTWYKPDEISKLSALCASPRSTKGLEKMSRFAEELTEKFGAVCMIEDIPYVDVSSTDVRDKIDRGESISGLVPSSVEAYIKEQGLYI